MEFFRYLECPVCSHSIPKIVRKTRPYENVQHFKRTCSRCRRRFQFTITWLEDRKVEVESMRIDDFQRTSRSES